MLTTDFGLASSMSMGSSDGNSSEPAAGTTPFLFDLTLTSSVDPDASATPDSLSLADQHQYSGLFNSISCTGFGLGAVANTLLEIVCTQGRGVISFSSCIVHLSAPPLGATTVGFTLYLNGVNQFSRGGTILPSPSGDSQTYTDLPSDIQIEAGDLVSIATQVASSSLSGGTITYQLNADQA